MIQERVAKFLKRSALKFYHMYKEAQELLDDYTYIYKRSELIDLNNEYHSKTKQIPSQKKIKKLTKKAETSKHRVKREMLIELSDSEESVKEESIKHEKCEWYNETEDSFFDKKPLPIKEDVANDIMDDYTKANTGTNYQPVADYSRTFYLPLTIPNNAVEYLDLDK